MKFSKLHGTGNDFILVDARDLDRPWPDVAIRLCQRRFGIGADGLILVLPSRVADYRMRIFNADGSEAEMCGNGIRCLARFVVDQGLVSPDAGTLKVETPAGIRQLIFSLHSGKVKRVRVSMGAPKFRPSEIPVKVTKVDRVIDYPLKVDGLRLTVTCLSLGNPHAVAILQDPIESFPLERVGPLVEHHPLFPKRVNFEVVNLVSRRQLRARVWERGVGETLACGSGACAIAVAARLRGMVGKKVGVQLSGGLLDLEWDGKGEVALTGPVELVYTGQVDT